MPKYHNRDLYLMLYTCTIKEKSKHDLGVGKGEVFQEFDLHPEGLIGVHSWRRAENKGPSRKRK